MNLSNLYSVAFDKKPFEVEKRSRGEFLFSTVIMDMIEEVAENKNEISFVGYYCYLLDSLGITLNDLEYALTRMDFGDGAKYQFDGLLYHNFCENKLFDEFNKAKKLMPQFIGARFDFDNAQNIDERYMSYSKLLLGLGGERALKAVLDEDYNKKGINYKDKKQGKTVEKIISEFYSLNNVQQDYERLLERLLEKTKKITPEKVHGIMKKMLAECTSNKVDQAQIVIQNNPKTMTANARRVTNGVEYKTQNGEANWQNITKISDMIIGQEEATTKVADKLMASFVGFGVEEKPVATFLMTGPTGVGKTETAKAVADLCYDGKLFVIDMSTFKNEGDVSRLLGASPQYIGYGDKNAFCDFVEANPHCVLLFDEIEKAHPSCLDLLMRMLDEGQFINATGKVIPLNNTVIFCTSNVTEYVAEKSMPVEQKITGAQGLRKEIVGRFDEVVEYRHLSKQDCKEIAKKFILAKIISNFESRNQNSGIKLDYTNSLIEKIVDEANTDLFGARDIKKTIQKYFITPVAKYILDNSPTNTCLLVSPNGITDVKQAQNQNENTEQQNKLSENNSEKNI